MGDAPSTFACGSCLFPLSKEDQITLCSGEADDPLEWVDCPACGNCFDITEVEVSIHPDANPLLALEEVMKTEWFHVSWSSDWHASLLQEEDIPYVHAGNQQSALDRYEGLYKGCYAYLYKFKLSPAALIAETIYDDLNEWPSTVNDTEDFPHQDGKRVDGFRYVNRWECPGSISILIDPRFINEVSSERIIMERIAA